MIDERYYYNSSQTVYYPPWESQTMNEGERNTSDISNDSESESNRDSESDSDSDSDSDYNYNLILTE